MTKTFWSWPKVTVELSFGWAIYRETTWASSLWKTTKLKKSFLFHSSVLNHVTCHSKWVRMNQTMSLMGRSCPHADTGVLAVGPQLTDSRICFLYPCALCSGSNGYSILILLNNILILFYSVLILDSVWFKALNMMYNKEGVFNWYDLYFV